MKKIEYKNKYIKMQSNKGFALFLGFRMKHFLVINTFFNPKSFVDFYSDIEKIKGVNCLEAINVYDDGSGYLIFLVDKDFDKKCIVNDVQTVFKDHFFSKIL